MRVLKGLAHIRLEKLERSEVGSGFIARRAHNKKRDERSSRGKITGRQQGLQQDQLEGCPVRRKEVGKVGKGEGKKKCF